PKARLPWEIGIPAMAGAEDGRSRLPDWIAHEGMRHRDCDPSDPQSPKIGVLGCLQQLVRGVFDLELQPHHPWHRLMLGTHALQTVPAEPTGPAAFKIEKRVRALGPLSVTVAGYSGDYAGYLTSAQEYESQQYEGGSTLYGRGS